METKNFLLILAILGVITILSSSVSAIFYIQPLALNVTNINIGDSWNATAQWNDTVTSALIEVNWNGTATNFTISGPFTGNWTNYTNVTNNSWTPGVKNVRIFANNTTDQNVTSQQNFTLWGWAQINQTLNLTSNVNDTQYTIWGCRVINANTTSPIENYTVSFYKYSQNLTEYNSEIGSNLTNSSGWAVFNMTIINAGFNYISCNITDSTTLYYNDTASNSFTNSTTVNDTSAPTVTLNSPSNDSWINTGTTNFTFIPSDNGKFSNCSLYLTNSSNDATTFAFNISNTSAIVNGTINGISRTMEDGNFTWNIKCFDHATLFNSSTNFSAFATGNYTFGLDTVNPTTPGTPSAQSKSTSWINIVWTASTDARSGIDHYVVYRSGTTVSSSVSASATTYNDTGLSAGTTYVYAVAAVDKAGNLANSSTNSISTDSTSTGGTSGSSGSLGVAAFVVGNLTPTSVTVTAGNTTSVNFNLITKNLARSLKNVVPTVTGINASWYTFNPSSIATMDIDQTIPVTLTFNPPYDAANGTYTVTIGATAQEVVTLINKTATTASLTLTVNPGSPPAVTQGGLPSGQGQSQPGFTFPTITLPENITGISLMVGLAAAVFVFIFRDEIYEKLKELRRPTYKPRKLGGEKPTQLPTQ